MPTQRFQNMPQEQQEKLLAEATAEFLEHGFERASLNRIIERTGTSKGALYYYFEDKADLYLTVIAASLKPAEEAMARFNMASHERSFWPDLQALIEGVIAIAITHPDLLRLVGGIRALMQSPDAARVDRVFEPFRKLMVDMVAAGQKDGQVRTDLPTGLIAACLYSLGEAIDIWMMGEFERSPKMEVEVETVVETYMDLFRRVAAPVPVIKHSKGNIKK